MTPTTTAATAPTTSPRRPDPITTRERLVAAAADVFHEQGVEGARLQDVARRAGLTTGAVYSNFRNKAELVSAAINARTASEIEELIRALPASELPETFRSLGRMLADPRFARRGLLLDAVVAARRDPELAAIVLERLERREDQLSEVAERARGAGALSDVVDPHALARFVIALALGTLVLRTLGVAPPEAEAWGQMIDKVVGALAPDPSSKETAP